MLEGVSRAHLRQHIFLEDLSHEVTLPSSTRRAAKHLGLKGEGFDATVGESQARKTPRALRLLRHCEHVLENNLGLPAVESRRRLQVSDCVPPFFLSPVCLQCVSAESPAGRRIGNRVSWARAFAFLYQCGEACDSMGELWPSSRGFILGQGRLPRERSFTPQAWQLGL